MSRWTLLVVTSLLLFPACSVDTFEPEGPQQPDPPEDPGDFAPSMVWSPDFGLPTDAGPRPRSSR
jgi:hypothetical protein